MLSALALEHIQRPRNCEPIADATAIGRFGSEGGGPYMTLWLVIENGRITNAAYRTYGCPSAVACASLTAELIKGRTVEQARLLEAKDLMTVLGGLPEGKEMCADMAISSLRDALGEI